MSADEWVKLIGAIAAALVMILGAVGALWAKVQQYQNRVDGRLTELLALTRVSSKAEGMLEAQAGTAGTPPEEDLAS